MEVTLGAFGLEDEIDKRALIRRVLEEGVIEPGSFANRLTDSRWLEFATNVGFGELGSLLNTQAQQEAIIDLYRTRQFERAIGETDLDLRLALNFRRDIKGLAQEGLATATGWFRVLGNEPLRTVIEGALNLPAEFGQLDVDVQAERIAERSREVFGNERVDVFVDDAVIEEAIKRYVADRSDPSWHSFRSKLSPNCAHIAAGLADRTAREREPVRLQPVMPMMRFR